MLWGVAPSTPLSKHNWCATKSEGYVGVVRAPPVVRKAKHPKSHI